MELYWIHPTTKALSLLTTPFIYDGATFPLQTYVGHEFEVRELANAKTGECYGGEQTCKIGHFAISENDDQVIRIKPGIQIEFSDNKVVAEEEAADVVSDCEDKAREMLEASGGSERVALLAMEELASCVEAAVARKLEIANEEIAFQAQVRTDIAALLENYTCTDEGSVTTPDISTDVWLQGDGIERPVHVKLDRPASRIHVVENFISEEECKAMEDEAAKTLHKATVADGKGGSQYSEARKAMQAGIKVKWDREGDGDAIARLSRRVYDYVNHVLDLNIRENGQEDLMSIQYFGRGMNDTEPDRYTPHCDGECTGLKHKPGTRMATMVMYCTLPEKGGNTNFRNAGVHVKAVKGNAIFFGYIDPKTMTMDSGFTEHSGCPVYEGEKKIVTQWVRLGVDDANPWNSFNTLGIKNSEADNQ